MSTFTLRKAKNLPQINRLGKKIIMPQSQRTEGSEMFRHQHPDERSVAQWQFDCARRGHIIELDRFASRD